jgi:hypothetical protein
MFIPTKNVEGFFAETVNICTADRIERIQRGSACRNLFLTGDEGGQPAIYNKTNDSIEDLSAWTFSSVDLRYLLRFPGGGSALQRAMCRAASHELLEQSRATDLDTTCEEATTWSYVLGKTFVKMLWTVDGLSPHLIMPEQMGVYNPGILDLDGQEAFVHSAWILPDQLKIHLRNHPDARNVFRKIMAQATVKQTGDSPDQINQYKQVLLGGFQPYTGQGGIGTTQTAPAFGIAQWMNTNPTYSPEMVRQLIRIDELWVRDDQSTDNEGRRDWTTLIGSGNVVIFGKEQRMNIFSSTYDPNSTDPRAAAIEDNPLAFQHPFVEFCPNLMQGNFWGRSELNNLALLQVQLNNRVNGINKLLRLQEDPPIMFLAGSMKDDKSKAKLTKPGGWLHDPDVTAKAPSVLAPNLPQGLYDSLQQNERMFDVMTGMTPTLQGMASPSVRSHGQTGQLTSNATPRFKKKAIRVERSAQAAAAKLYNLLRAKSTDLITAWVMPGQDQSPWLKGKMIDPSVEPPAPGMKGFQFYMYEMPANVRVMVDGHSASPAFGEESQDKAILLRKGNAIGTPSFIEAINPPDAEALVAEAETAEIAAAAAQQQQAAQAAANGGQPHGKPGVKK